MQAFAYPRCLRGVGGRRRPLSLVEVVYLVVGVGRDQGNYIEALSLTEADV